MGFSPILIPRELQKGSPLKGIRALTAIILTFSLLACSQSRSPLEESVETTRQSQAFSAHEQALPSHKAKFISWEDGLYKAIRHYQNDCKDCPASVAQVLVKNSMQCFGGLIAEDIVMTSRHCLPKTLLTKGASCKGLVRFFFSGNENFNARAMGCDEVVDFIPEPLWAKRQRRRGQKRDLTPHPDWVLLRTRKKMPRRMADIKKDGIADAKKLFVYFPRFDHQAGLVRVKKVECESVQRSPFFPFYIYDTSPLVSIRCNEQLTKGSSGSNVYNEDGQIVGTISHGLAYIKREKKLHFKTIAGKAYTPWLAVNNLSCILDVKDEDKEDCKFDPKMRKKLRKWIFLGHIKKAGQKAEKAFEQWQTQVNLPLRWEPISTDSLEDLPDSYQKIFSKRQNRRKSWLNPRGNQALTKLFIPSYPKCLEKPLDFTNIPYPYAKVRIMRTPLRRVHIDIQFASTKGLILRKGANEWGFHFLTGHSKPRSLVSEMDFFHPGNPPLHHRQLSLCE